MTKFIITAFLCACISLNAQERITEDDDQQFIDFLISMDSSTVDAKTTQMFYQRTGDYWRKHMLDYNQNPEKYRKAMSLYHKNQRKYLRNYPSQIDLYENEIDRFRRFDNRNTLIKNPILFIGSSSIVCWETAKSFPDLPVVNRGFGGASIPQIIYYYDDVIKKHSPSIVIIYCDIDIEHEISPKVAVSSYKELLNKIRSDFPLTQVLVLSMKPTLIDDFKGKDIGKNKITANRMLSDYCNDEKNLHYVDVTKTMLNSDGSVRSDIFLPDGLHMNALGYTLWDPIIRAKIMDLCK